jgi:hypothetical protein
MILSAVERVLTDIRNLLSRGDKGKKCIGYEAISVGDTTPMTLTKAPSSSFSAIITVEGDSTVASSSKVVRFTEDGTTPTATIGMPLGNLDTYEVQFLDNIQAFKCLGIEAGKTHSLKVQYYQQS